MGEGFKLAMTLIIGFFILAGASLTMLYLKATDPATLKTVFEGLGILATMLGFPQIISNWLATRGQTTKVKAESQVTAPASGAT